MNTTGTMFQLAELAIMYTDTMSKINSIIWSNANGEIPEIKALENIERVVVEAGAKHDVILKENAMDRAQRHRREALPQKINARDMHDTDCRDITTDTQQDS